MNHAFPILQLPEPHAWVAWNLAGAADRLDELAFQVKLVRSSVFLKPRFFQKASNGT